MDLSKIKKIYMIGIKGVGMTMLAQFLAERGYEVSGSDIDEKFMTDEVLEKVGIKVTEKFDENNISKDTDLIIYSTAYNKNTNVEVGFALDSKIKTVKFAEALGEVFNQHYGIAVVGTHGKTTTTAWLGYVMDRAGKSPSVMVGARVPQFDGASIVGKSDYLVVESDEYQNKLEHYKPNVVLLNNIEYDHPDFFPTKGDYVDAFIEFIKKLPKDGILVANFDDPEIRKIAQVNCRGRVATYAINEAADYVAYDIKVDPSTGSGQGNGKQYFKVKLGSSFSGFDEDEEVIDTELGDFSIEMPGRHNIYNALAVIAACVEMEMDLVSIRTHLESFTGTARRMEVMGEYRGATIVDDYAHHPTEVRATLDSVKQRYSDKTIKVVFHPHTFTRTKALLDEFAQSFDLADEVIVLDIYGSAREEQGGVHSSDLVEKIIKHGVHSTEQVKNIATLKEVEEYLRENIERGDLVLLLGAGDVFRVGEALVKS